MTSRNMRRSGLQRKLDLVFELGIPGLQLVEVATKLGDDGVRSHAGSEPDIDVNRAEVRNVVRSAELDIPAPAAENAPHIDERKCGKLRIVWPGELHVLDHFDDLGHLDDRVDAFFFDRDVGRSAEHVNGELHDACVLRANEAGAGRLAHDREIGAKTGLQEMDGARSALELTDDARDDDIAAQGDAHALECDGRHHHGCQPAFHVSEAGAPQHVALHGGCPRIRAHTARNRVDVDVTIEHEALAAATPRQPRNRLKAARIDLLELGLETLATKEVVQEASARRFLGREARNPCELFCELDELLAIHARAGL